MSDLRKLYKQTGAVFWQWPVLWLPMMVAELVRFAAYLIFARLATFAIRHLVTQSVFGGYGGGGTRIQWRAVITSATLGALGNCVGIFAYLFALGVIAHQVSNWQVGSSPKLETYVPILLKGTFLRIIGFLVLAAGSAVLPFMILSTTSFIAAAMVAIILFWAVLYLMIPTLQSFVRANVAVMTMHKIGVDYLLIIQAFTLSMTIYYASRFVLYQDKATQNVLQMPFWSFSLLVPVALVATLPYVYSAIALSLSVDRLTTEEAV